MFVGEAAIEARHQSPARQHNAFDFRVSSWNTAGQRRVFEDAMQIRRNLLEAKIVFFVVSSGTEWQPIRSPTKEAIAALIAAANPKPRIA